MRAVPIFIVLTGVGSVVLALPAAAQNSARESTIARVRRSLEAGAFDKAARQIAARPASAFETDVETLTLRGIARWGAALQRCGALDVKATPVNLLSQVKQLVGRAAREHPAGTKIGDTVARSIVEVEAEYTRHLQDLGQIGRSANEVYGLFAAAEADFARAVRIRRHTKAQWCESPGRWLILARAHRFVVWRQHLRWGQDILTAPGAAKLSPDREKAEQQLKDLENSIVQEMDRQLAEATGKPDEALVLHATADALLAVGLASGRIARWPEVRTATAGSQGGRSVPARVATPQPSIAAVRTMLADDPLTAVVILYRLCSRHEGSSVAADTAYTNFLIRYKSGESGADRLAALTGELKLRNPKENALYSLEKARLFSQQEGKDADMPKALTEAESHRLSRPFWTAAPSPVRTAFLKLPVWLGLGRRVSLDYESVINKLKQAAGSTSNPTLKAQLEALRLRLGLTLTTSDLPWDRERGYQLAGEALAEIGKLQSALTPPQLASYAALDARLRAAVAKEQFPSTLCALLPDGRLVWVEDPLTDGRTTLRNPIALVHRDGPNLLRLPRP